MLYSQRKKLDSITQMLSRYVPPMYAYTVEASKDPGMQPKLEKLIGVWEGSKYFSDQCFKVSLFVRLYKSCLATTKS